MTRALLLALVVPVVLFFTTGCVTKSELRRDAEVEKLKAELREVKGDRANEDNAGEEFKVEISRMNNIVEERAAQNQRQLEEIKLQLAQMTTKMTALEQRLETVAASEANRSSQPREPVAPVERVKPTYELGKKFFDDKKYDEAIDVLKAVKSKAARPDDQKKAQFLLAESYFANKEYASAALEYSDYKRVYPKDPLVPQAIYRQANAFKSMQKPKEAKLFYQELVERYPKNPLIAKAKQELRKLK